MKKYFVITLLMVGFSTKASESKEQPLEFIVPTTLEDLKEYHTNACSSYFPEVQSHGDFEIPVNTALRTNFSEKDGYAIVKLPSCHNSQIKKSFFVFMDEKSIEDDKYCFLVSSKDKSKAFMKAFRGYSTLTFERDCLGRKETTKTVGLVGEDCTEIVLTTIKHPDQYYYLGCYGLLSMATMGAALLAYTQK